MIDFDSFDGVDLRNTDSSAPSRTLEATTGSSQQHEQSARSSAGDEYNKNNDILSCLLITANVGTIFEDATLLAYWMKQLKCYITKLRPQIVALHCQEVGGKNFETSMRYVGDFTNEIIGDEFISAEYKRVRIFLDEDFMNLDKFTALGSYYLIHNSVNDVKLYNFKTAQYDPVEGSRTYAGSSTNDEADYIEKVKFPPNLFPECKWSRKGFMRTRWLFNDVQPVDLANIHLFHDASNIIAMEECASPYAANRGRALDFTLKRLARPLDGTWKNLNNNLDHQQQLNLEVPLFIFGDFNFRLETKSVVRRMTDNAQPVVKRNDDNEVLQLVYHKKSDTPKSEQQQEQEKLEPMQQRPNASEAANDNAKGAETGKGVFMTIEKKLFDFEQLDEFFRNGINAEWLKELDTEPRSFGDRLFEFSIKFDPSYPFKEDSSGGYSYMKTRCPAWCDRVLFNRAGSHLINSNSYSQANESCDEQKRMKNIQDRGAVLYRLMGDRVPMGDHKPVVLFCQLNLAHGSLSSPTSAAS